MVSPEDCACCGELATQARALSDGAGSHLLVGYCDECAAHAATGATRRFAAVFAGVLLGGSIAAGGPLAWPWLSALESAALAALGALLPPLVSRAFERPSKGHVTAAAAVFFRGPGELVALRSEWASALARAHGVTLRPSSPRSRWSARVLVLAGVCAALALAFHRFHHPLLRVLNLGDVTLELFADERRVGRVEPSSAESASAGLELRLPAGRRRLEVRDLSGNTLASTGARLFSGKYHLYAPASPEVCFWVETQTYGRQSELIRSPPLDGDARFWVLPEEVQGLFAPAPAPLEGGELRSTGGRSVVLRQGRCPPR